MCLQVKLCKQVLLHAPILLSLKFVCANCLAFLNMCPKWCCTCICCTLSTNYSPVAGQQPILLSLRVTRKMQQGGIIAATSFGGIPLDFEVTEAERKLRAALLLDGHKGQEGYQLARYNDPFTLPFLRRNEVLIEVDFELE